MPDTNTKTESHLTAWGTLHVSGADYMRLVAEWNAAHGQPKNGAMLIVRDQWVDAQVLAELEARS
jgi:hypothetical protein